MRPLLKVMFILICVFGSTFIIGRLLGILTVDNVRIWLTWASEIEDIYVIGLVIILLFADIIIAVPTLTITILAGFFLGFPNGGIVAFIGMASATFSGYALSQRWGEHAIAKLIKNENDRKDLTSIFLKNGPIMILLARAAPMIPEVTACLAGATKMPFSRYAFLFTLSSLPYALIASYAGSISTIDDPMPAIYAALGLYVILWLGWWIFRRRSSKN